MWKARGSASAGYSHEPAVLVITAGVYVQSAKMRKIGRNLLPRNWAGNYWQIHIVKILSKLGLDKFHLGEIYLPEAVLVETLDGKLLPALCYICHDMKPRPAANDYIDRVVKPAREYGFPEWYIERLESFRPEF